MMEGLEGRRLMAVGSVTSVSLIDATSERVVGVVQNGSTLNLATLPSKSLNFRADVTGTVQSVRLALDGTARTRTENAAPYTLAGDSGGNYYGFTPTVGAHTLVATPYEFDSARGAVGTASKVSFNVVNSTTTPTPPPPTSTAPQVTRFVLVNADTNQDVMTLSNGATLDRSKLPANLNARAEVAGTVSQVRFTIDGATRGETAAPYSVGGDYNGDFHAWKLGTGSHTIKAVAYNGTLAGAANTISFQIVDGVTTTPTTPTPAPSTGAFRESNGLVVMEAESLPTPSAWSRRTAIAGYTGSGYIQSNVSASSGGTGTVTFKFVISRAGNYEFRFRSRIATGTSGTEHNDSFVRFPTGKNVTGEWALSGWTKAYTNRTGAWSWQTSTKDHDPQRIRQYFSAGEHSVQIAVRSSGHAIDRLVLYNYDTVGYSDTKFNGLPESARA